jgi:hypothetical protein
VAADSISLSSLKRTAAVTRWDKNALRQIVLGGDGLRDVIRQAPVNGQSAAESQRTPDRQMHRLVNPNLRKKSSRKRIITSYGKLPESRLQPVLNLLNGGDPDNFLDRTIPPSKSRRCNGATPEFWPGGVPAGAVQAILLRPITCRHQTRRDHIGTIAIRTERDEVPSQARRALYAIANSECHENLLHPLAM